MKIGNIFEELLLEKNHMDTAMEDMNIPEGLITYGIRRIHKKFGFWCVKAHVDAFVNNVEQNGDGDWIESGGDLIVTPQEVSTYINGYYKEIVKDKFKDNQDEITNTFGIPVDSVTHEISFHGGKIRIEINDTRFEHKFSPDRYASNDIADLKQSLPFSNDVVQITLDEGGQHAIYKSLFTEETRNLDGASLARLIKLDLPRLKEAFEDKMIEIYKEADILAGEHVFTRNTFNKEQFDTIINIFKIQKKPKTNINALTFAKAYNNASKWSYIKDWAIDPALEPPELENMTWDEAYSEAKAWYDNAQTGQASAPENGQILKRLDGGIYIIDLGMAYSEDERRVMQHCGTPTGAEIYGTRPSPTHNLLSVRQSNKTRFMTFDWNKSILEIIQFKGKQNQVPDSKYHPIIIEIISNPSIVKHLNTHKGYLPHTNFQLSHLPPKKIMKVLENNPELTFGVDYFFNGNGGSNTGIANKSLMASALLLAKGPIWSNLELSIALKHVDPTFDGVQDIVDGTIPFLKDSDSYTNKVISTLMSLTRNPSDTLNKILEIKGDAFDNRDLYKMLGNIRQDNENRDEVIVTIVNQMDKERELGRDILKKAIMLAKNKQSLLDALTDKLDLISNNDIDDMLDVAGDSKGELINLFRTIKQSTGDENMGDKFMYAKHMRDDKAKILDMFQSSPQFRPAMTYMERNNMTNIKDLIDRLDSGQLEDEEMNARSAEESEWLEDVMSVTQYLKGLFK